MKIIRIMKRKTFILMAACSLLFACEKEQGYDGYPVIADDVAEGYAGYELEWSDEFGQDGVPDAHVWRAVAWQSPDDEELQDYRTDDLKSARVENGTFVIEAYQDVHDGYDYSSSYIQSLNTFKTGRIDVAAKIPVGRGIYPTIKLVPTDGTDAEITLVDYVFDGEEGTYVNNFAIHTPYTRSLGLSTGVAPAPVESGTLESRYHIYSLLWTESRVELLFDNSIVLTYDKPGDSVDRWPFDRDFRLEMNVAVGGRGGIYGVDPTIFPKRMTVEYIRHYQPEAGDGTPED